MACLNTLKQDIKRLEGVFPKSHECFQLISATVDELTCRFVNKNGKKIDIYANFTVSIMLLRLKERMKITHVLIPNQETYPQTPPVWFSESEDAFVSNIVQALSEKSGPDCYVSIISAIIIVLLLN